METRNDKLIKTILLFDTQHVLPQVQMNIHFIAGRQGFMLVRLSSMLDGQPNVPEIGDHTIGTKLRTLFRLLAVAIKDSEGWLDLNSIHSEHL